MYTINSLVSCAYINWDDNHPGQIAFADFGSITVFQAAFGYDNIPQPIGLPVLVVKANTKTAGRALRSLRRFCKRYPNHVAHY